ncbi:hypothetical protein B0T10DRAFT_291311 [Thelonectria olida]|uniref:Uncharacterized protein n=1 Tax=Thelonectria olida TaxID=1576542 RepID=A0A9P8WA79_9HYPO|nr:hypothetical protein B0T10DRAFT_291311 [Thelonectria olida]
MGARGLASPVMKGTGVLEKPKLEATFGGDSAKEKLSCATKRNKLESKCTNSTMRTDWLLLDPSRPNSYSHARQTGNRHSGWHGRTTMRMSKKRVRRPPADCCARGGSSIVSRQSFCTCIWGLPPSRGMACVVTSGNRGASSTLAQNVSLDERTKLQRTDGCHSHSPKKEVLRIFPRQGDLSFVNTTSRQTRQDNSYATTGRRRPSFFLAQSLTHRITKHPRHQRGGISKNNTNYGHFVPDQDPMSWP